MTDKIDLWENVRFVANSDVIFSMGCTAELITDSTEWDLNRKILSGNGMFSGVSPINKHIKIDIVETVLGYAVFDSFDIYFNGIRINDYTWSEYLRLVQIQKRANKLKEIYGDD